MTPHSLEGVYWHKRNSCYNILNNNTLIHDSFNIAVILPVLQKQDILRRRKTLFWVGLGESKEKNYS
jgi:hypothetical protein